MNRIRDWFADEDGTVASMLLLGMLSAVLVIAIAILLAVIFGTPYSSLEHFETAYTECKALGTLDEEACRAYAASQVEDSGSTIILPMTTGR